MNPYQVTNDFEAALSEYTGAPYAVAVNSCTAALMLAVAWHIEHWGTSKFPMPHMDMEIEIPKRTYVSVPCAIRLAGGGVRWRDENWRGAYQLKPLPVWDCARRFTCNMFGEAFKGMDLFQCVSFSTTKILGLEQGGAILHNNDAADSWLRRMRFDGRTEGIDQREDDFTLIGHHCIMLPSTAAALTLKLYHLPLQNEDLPDYPYPDLSKFQVFK